MMMIHACAYAFPLKRENTRRRKFLNLYYLPFSILLRVHYNSCIHSNNMWVACIRNVHIALFSSKYYETGVNRQTKKILTPNPHITLPSGEVVWLFNISFCLLHLSIHSILTIQFIHAPCTHSSMTSLYRPSQTSRCMHDFSFNCR